ncbi:MAG: thioredoxin family protein [Ignavibacteriaceae bacterium]
MNDSIKDALKNKSLTFPEFLAKAEGKINSGEGIAPDLFEYTKLNIHRMKRILKTYTPSEEIAKRIKNIEREMIWMVITEDWCGDSAQNLPYIYKIAELSEKIKFCIIERDSNPEIMDQYLTSGARSVPKLVCFDDREHEIFQWGARPSGAAELIKNLKAEGVEKEKMIEKLHLWYANNKGKEIEAEFSELIDRK